MRYIKFLSLLLSFIIILTVCGCSGNTAESVIYIEVNSAPMTVDPQLAKSDSELMLVRNLFEGLLRKDENGDIVPAIAQSFTNEGLKYTFHLSETAVWSNGTPVTANDFVFALKRALNPDTASPFAEKLFAVRNAEIIHKGAAGTDSLGVYATDDYTLEIYLTYDDTLFLETLASGVCMPCNEEFFNACKGKYGLDKNNIITNGSYRLSKWNTDVFAARMLKSDNYFGNFAAKNKGVYISLSDEKTPLELLKKKSVDIAQITNSDVAEAKEEGLKIADFENICWVMTLSDTYPEQLRKSLITSINRELYADSLKSGYNVAYSFFPEILSEPSADGAGIIQYDIEEAKKLFKNAVKNLEKKKFPTTTLTFYSGGEMQGAINDIVGHWQQNLGAYINVTPTDNLEAIQKNLTARTDQIAVFPVKIDDGNIYTYVSKFGHNYENFTSAVDLQETLLTKYTLIPIAFQSTVIGYSDDIANIVPENGNGMIDFAYVVKNQ